MNCGGKMCKPRVWRSVPLFPGRNIVPVRTERFFDVGQSSIRQEESPADGRFLAVWLLCLKDDACFGRRGWGDDAAVASFHCFMCGIGRELPDTPTGPILRKDKREMATLAPRNRKIGIALKNILPATDFRRLG